MVGGEHESFQLQALEAHEPDEYFDPTIPPKNGNEYLTHMIYERKSCPAVVTKRPACLSKTGMHCDTELLTNETNAQEENLDLLPTLEWKQIQSKNFEAAREKILKLRREVSVPDDMPSFVSDNWYSYCYENKPTTRNVLSLNQRALAKLLDHIYTELDVEGLENNIGSEIKATPSLPLYAGASRPVVVDLANSEYWLGVWLYALLACLQPPLEPEVHSTLRNIARSCICQRNKLQPQELRKAEPYNLFIHIIASAFQQFDFAKYV